MLLLLLKKILCDTAATQKGAFQLQMEENSSRYSSKQIYFYRSEIGLEVQCIQSRGCRKGREGSKERRT